MKCEKLMSFLIKLVFHLFISVTGTPVGPNHIFKTVISCTKPKLILTNYISDESLQSLVSI